MFALRCLFGGHSYGPAIAQDSYSGDITVECARCGHRWEENGYIVQAYRERRNENGRG